MAEQNTALNKYIADYDTLRPFLRYISYGCYNKQYFARHLGINTRTFENNLFRIRFFLPDNVLKTQKQGHRDVHSIKGDSYYSADNYLHVTYQIKNCRPNVVFSMLGLLQIIENSCDHLTADDIFFDRFYSDEDNEPALAPIEDGVINIKKKVIKTRLKELTDLGLILYHDRTPATYSAAANPFEALMDEEITELLYAIQYYMAIAPISLPGYQLSNALQIMYNQSSIKKSLCQFKHNRIVRTLDDDVLFEINSAMEFNNFLTFSYGKKTVQAVPYHVYIDFLTGRHYLFALAKRTPLSTTFKQAQTYRIDMMQDVRRSELSIDDINRLPLYLTPELYQVNLRITCEDEQRLNSLKYRIKSRHPDAVFELDENELSVIVHINVPDTLKVLPWLRTLYPYVEVLEKDSVLHKRMIKDIKEALANYE